MIHTKINSSESRRSNKHRLHQITALHFRLKIDECREFVEFEELLRLSFGFDPVAGNILFIDESQESMALGQFVRFMKESWPRCRRGSGRQQCQQA